MSQRQRPAEFIDMPLELSERIAYLLDLNTILSLRCTCKYLFQVTNSWRIWIKIAQDMMSNPQLFIHRQPLEYYTVQELTNWVLQRHGAQRLLRSDLPAKFQERRVPENCYKSQVKLLPGGRWLLFTNGRNLFFADCDAETLEPQILISSKGPPGDTYLRFITWVDSGAERLSFRVALIHWESEARGWNADSSQFWVTFYNVNLVGHGSTTTLVSKPLSKGKQHHGNIVMGLHFEDLNSQNFILLRVKSKEESVLSSPVIYHISDYADPSSSGDFQTVELTGFWAPTKDLYILPENKFAVVNWANTITIFPIPTTKTESIEPLYRIPSDPTFENHRTPALYYQSTLHVGETSTTVVYKSGVEKKMAYKVISLPHQIDEQQQQQPAVQFITNYTPVENEDLAFLGLRSSLSLVYREETGLSLKLTNCSWSDRAAVTEGEFSVKEFGIGDLFGTKVYDFNEEIGRVVIHSDWGVSSSNTFVLDVMKA